MDSDGDGVLDSRDQCSNTEANASVNLDGCPVQFGTNSDESKSSNLQLYSAVIGIIAGLLAVSYTHLRAHETR